MGRSLWFAAAEALVLKVRENGQTVNVHTLLATGVNAEDYWEILGLHFTSAEDGAGWLVSSAIWPPVGCPGWPWSPLMCTAG